MPFRLVFGISLRGGGFGVIAFTLPAVGSWKTQNPQEDICDPWRVFRCPTKTVHNTIPNGSGFGLPARGAILLPCFEGLERISQIQSRKKVCFSPSTGSGKSNHQRIVSKSRKNWGCAGLSLWFFYLLRCHFGAFL